MKKIFTLIALFALAVGANAQTWNFSDEKFSGLGTIDKETTIDGLTIMATSEALVSVDNNKKSLDDFSFTSRLKLGGSGSLEARHVHFTVEANSKVTIYGMSANSSATDRNLVIASGSFDNKVYDAPLLGDQLYKVEQVIADAGTVYVYSGNSGLNFYAIIVTSNSSGEQGGEGGEGGDTTGSTDSYVAVTAEGLAPEFAAVVGEGNVATNVVDNNSVVRVEKENITMEAVASATPKEVSKDAILSWNDVKWEKKSQGDISFDFIQGTGVCYTSWAYEEIIRDGEPTGEYRMLIGTDDNGWPNFYVTDGSHGLPISGLYYKYTPKVNGTLKMGVWMNKGNRRLFVVPSDTKQAIDYEVEGYITGQNETYTKEDGTEGSRKKYLTNDEIRALGTDPYVMGAGNQPFWGYVTVGLEAGKDYYIFSQNAQVGFQGFEFTTGGDTAVREIVTEKFDANAPAYNIAGQRVARNTKGIVIINGKKYLNK